MSEQWHVGQQVIVKSGYGRAGAGDKTGTIIKIARKYLTIETVPGSAWSHDEFDIETGYGRKLTRSWITTPEREAAKQHLDDVTRRIRNGLGLEELRISGRTFDNVPLAKLEAIAAILEGP